MLTGIDIVETIEYVSEQDTDTENPTKFLLGNIPSGQRFSLLGGCFDPDGKPDMSKLSGKATEIVRAGLKGVVGLYDKKVQKKVDYKEHQINTAVINKLSMEVIGELMSKIVEINFVSESDQKN